MADPHRIDAEGRPYDPAGLDLKPEVGVDGFAALDLRVGRVVEVADHPAARDPAYQLTIDLGPRLGNRRSSAKITNYRREQLLGRQVIVAANLGSRRVAGFVSEVLVLGALEPDGTVRLLEVDGEVAPGSVVA